MDSTPKSPERAFTLQKYLLLHSQHEALQNHLSKISHSISSSSTSPSHSRESSISSSPDSISPPPPRHHHRTLSNHRLQRPAMIKRRSSLPEEGRIGEILAEESKLRDVNMQLKNTLMEMLACESVRGDGKSRRWVQGRLMEIERELRGGRRGSLCGRLTIGGSGHDMDGFGEKLKGIKV